LNHLVLASSSPRRKQLLESCGYTLEILIPNIEEAPKSGETPQNYALRNAKEKGFAIAKNHNGKEIIVSADTIVVTKEGQILEKPLNHQHAHDMLSMLSNNVHLVYTAYSLHQNQKEIVSKIIETKVTFRKLFHDEIESYIATGEPFDKAGSYGIQGGAMSFVERVEGSYTNVMGLPLSDVVQDLRGLAYN
jgi:septum formation protein